MYYGTQKIKDVEKGPTDETVIVVFEDDSKRLFVRKILEASQSPEPINPTELRAKRCLPTITKVLELLRDDDVHMVDVDYIFQTAVLSLNESVKKADNQFWKNALPPHYSSVDKQGFLDLTVQGIDYVLIKRPEKSE